MNQEVRVGNIYLPLVLRLLYFWNSSQTKLYTFLERIADHNSQMKFLTKSIGTVQAPHHGEILVNTTTLNLSAMMMDTLRSLALQ